MSVARTIALAWIWCCARIVPASHRGTWRAQWRADLWHYHRWLQREGTLGVRGSCSLLGRAWGALPHAVVLRVTGWSLLMLSHDLKVAVRMLAWRPAFTLVAVLILGLGIGANATIFSWLRSVVLQPLPGVDIAPLIAVHATTPTRGDLDFSYPNFRDLRLSPPAEIEDLAAFRVVAINLRGDGEPHRIWGQLVTPNFFDVLRVSPMLGRGFTESADATPGGEPVVVLSHGVWQRQFGADPSIVGRSITLNARPFTVIGVAPPRFRGSVAGLSMDVFVPLAQQRAFMTGDRLTQRGNGFLEVYARLRPGASLDQAQPSFDVIAARLALEYPENAGRGIIAESLWKNGAAGMLLPMMSTLMAVVGVILLIACANVAGLLLARAAGREREVAVRLALGASRGRVVRQFMIESFLLAVAGGAAGLLLTTWTSGLLRLLIPPTPLPIAFERELSPAVVLYAVGSTFVAAIAFGLLPAMRASRADVGVTLKDVTSAVSASHARTRMRSALVMVQVALSLVLLICAALFARGISRAQRLDPGFSMREGVIAAMDLLPGGYDAAHGSLFHHRLLERVGELPGVVSATLASTMPLDVGSGSGMQVKIDGYVPAAGEEVQSHYNRVGPRYFETMGIDIIVGRALDEHDAPGQPLAVVVNETMARNYWPGGHAVGGTLHFADGRASVVGIARDGKYGHLGEKPRNYMYVSLAQVFRHDALLIARTTGTPSAVVPSLHAAVRALDPTLPLFDVRTVAEHLRLSVFIPRIAGSVLGVFGLLALVLAVIGLYSVIALGVAQRTREIGLRMALGGTRRDVFRLVLRQCIVLTGAGLAIGTALAIPAAQALRSQLVGVSPGDVVSFAAPAALLFLVAVAACALPAVRATNTDPISALRRD